MHDETRTKRSYWTRNVYLFSLQLLPEIFLILRRLLRDEHKFSCKVLVILVEIYRNLILFLARLSKNSQI
jgi:hypothetical protein